MYLHELIHELEIVHAWSWFVAGIVVGMVLFVVISVLTNKR